MQRNANVLPEYQSQSRVKKCRNRILLLLLKLIINFSFSSEVSDEFLFYQSFLDIPVIIMGKVFFIEFYQLAEIFCALAMSFILIGIFDFSSN